MREQLLLIESAPDAQGVVPPRREVYYGDNRLVPLL